MVVFNNEWHGRPAPPRAMAVAMLSAQQDDDDDDKGERKACCVKHCPLSRVVRALLAVAILALVLMFQNQVSEMVANARTSLQQLPLAPVVFASLVINTFR